MVICIPRLIFPGFSYHSIFSLEFLSAWFHLLLSVPVFWQNMKKIFCKGRETPGLEKNREIEKGNNIKHKIILIS